MACDRQIRVAPGPEVLPYACLALIWAANSWAMWLPEASGPFWQSLGFEEIPPRYGHNRWMMLRIGKQHYLPPGIPAEVVIRTFDAEALYRSAVAPLSEYRPAAVLVADGSVQLAERIVLHEPGLGYGCDLAVEISLNGTRLVFDNVTREGMEALGLRHDRFRQFFVDRIYSQAAVGDHVS